MNIKYTVNNTPALNFYSESGIEPFYGTEDSAGLDLPIWDERLKNGYLSWDGEYTLQPMEALTVKTGVYMSIPEGHYGQLDTRSSTSKIKLDLLCHTIDSDYRGNIRLALINLNTVPVTIKNGQSLAQIIIKKYEKVEPVKFESYDEFLENSKQTPRGDKGFGSTGRNV